MYLGPKERRPHCLSLDDPLNTADSYFADGVCTHLCHCTHTDQDSFLTEPTSNTETYRASGGDYDRTSREQNLVEQQRLFQQQQQALLGLPQHTQHPSQPQTFAHPSNPSTPLPMYQPTSGLASSLPTAPSMNPTMSSTRMPTSAPGMGGGGTGTGTGMAGGGEVSSLRPPPPKEEPHGLLLQIKQSVEKQAEVSGRKDTKRRNWW
jgi:hypothetical protein